MIDRSRMHLEAAGERYFQHMRFAATVGLLAIGAGLACLIHAIVPALCTRTASRTIRHLTALFDDRDLLPEVREEATDLMAFVLLVMLVGALVGLLWTAAMPTALAWAYTATACAIPATLLLVNRELEAQVSDEPPPHDGGV